MAVTTVSCDRCTFQHQVVSEPRQYLLPGNLTLPVYTNFAWCHTCESVTEVEDLPEAASIQHHLMWLEKNETAARSRLQSTCYHEEKAFYRRLLNWRRTRDAPPRCLTCGRPGFSTFDTVQDPHSRGVVIQAVHPHCGGQLGFSTAPKRVLERYYFYTPEGKAATPPEDDQRFTQR